MSTAISTKDRPAVTEHGHYDYSRAKAPDGYCPVCWHRDGRAISEAGCTKHTPDEKKFYRLNELQSREGRS